MNTKDNIKPFGFKRNFDYIKVNFWLMYKRLIEYKINMYSALFTQTFYILSFFFFFHIIHSLFGDIINWTKYDFLLYFFLIDTFWMIAGIFLWQNSLYFEIKQGNLNYYLVKPIKVFVANYFKNIDVGGIIMILINIPIIIYLVFFNNSFLISNIFLIFLISILIILLIFFVLTFIDSLNFKYLGLSIAINMFLGSVFFITNQYPYQFFKKFRFRAILFLFHSTFIAILLIPIIKNYNVWNLYLQLFILISLILVFSSLTFYNWYKGLKNYSAFG